MVKLSNKLDTVTQFKLGSETKSIIFFHPIGGSCIPYCRLVGNINNNFSCYGINFPAHDYIDAASPSVNSLTNFYCELIIEKFCELPCILIGWSFGGLLAYEVARRLNNKNVVQVIMIDACFAFPGHIDYYFKSNLITESSLLQLFYNDLLHSANKAADSVKNISITTFDELIKRMSDDLKLITVSKLEYDYLLNSFEQFRYNIIALLEYSPETYHGNVDHIIAEEQINNITLDQVAWTHLVEKESSFSSIQANHYTILNHPKTTDLINTLIARC